jgi:sugar/nucleoside kinase (ribokinase family)
MPIAETVETQTMIVVLGDLIADLALRIPSFPIQATQLQQVEYLEIGPGGAANVAIMAARLGLSVACLGEVGTDRFGEILLEGLRAEGIDTAGVLARRESETPVAGVIVDRAGEPAYLGYPGKLSVRTLTPEWTNALRSAQAAFSDGWVDHDHLPALILEAMRCAIQSGVPYFFDPGPGNPRFDLAWHKEACSLARVVLATEEEALRLTGLADPVESAKGLLRRGPEMVVLKRGAAGCVIVREGEVQIAPGFPVESLDATGAGDSLNAAVMVAYLRGLSLEEMGVLANAAGAAKVQKLGTGRNLPTMEEIQALLQRFGADSPRLARHSMPK